MTAALIIAAGKTRRPKAFQPQKRLGGISAVEWQVQVFRMAGIQRIVVIMQLGNQTLEKQLSHLGAVVLRGDEKADAEMLDNVKLGLRHLQKSYRRVLVTPVDVPLFSVETVRRLLATRRRVAIPSHKQKAGHPVLLSGGMFAHILAYEGPNGLSGALKVGGAAPHYVEVADEGVVAGVNDEALDALAQAHRLQCVHAVQRVYLAKEKVFFGPGPHQLLGLLEESASLRTACEQMGISYSKGWKMLEKMEKQLGYSLVQRRRGGQEKGSTEITEKGRLLLRTYSAFVQECGEQTEKLFEKYFGKLF